MSHVVTEGAGLEIADPAGVESGRRGSLTLRDKDLLPLCAHVSSKCSSSQPLVANILRCRMWYSAPYLQQMLLQSSLYPRSASCWLVDVLMFVHCLAHESPKFLFHRKEKSIPLICIKGKLGQRALLPCCLTAPWRLPQETTYPHSW